MGWGYIGLNGLATLLIFLGFGVNCAWPFLHPWLTDAYPEATITGTVFLSAFTTKCAVYALARAFPGTEALIWIGAIMTAFPIFYAVIENNLRRVLSYSLINQVGFMVCGIGIGTQMALNGAVSHAVNDILFKALLFMSMGAVMYRTGGKINCTALGGLYRTMPLTCICCIIGAASISAVPLFSGFVSKSMVMEAAATGHMQIIWFILLFASVGVLEHAGIKIPFFAFFGHDSGLRPREAPLHMLLAMGIAAFFCIFNGSFPSYLYSLLPYPVDYVPYTVPHVVGQTQLIFFAAFAFILLTLSGMSPSELRAVNLDADWFYRKGGGLFYRVMDISMNGLTRVADRVIVGELTGSICRISQRWPEVLCLGAMIPLWSVTGIKGKDLEDKIERTRAAIQTHTSPIGISAATATIFLVLIYLLM